METHAPTPAPSTPEILHGDARNLPLADESVDLIVTSPPYFGLRSYTDNGQHYPGQLGDEPTPAEFVKSLVECTREMARVLKPSGSIFVNVGDKYSTYESRPGKAASHEWAAKSQQAGRYVRNAPKVYGVPYKSLMGIPWKYALAVMSPPQEALSLDLAHELLDLIEEGECSFDGARGILDEHADGVGGLGLILRQELIWSKGSVAPTRITDRARRTHEHFFHFTKREKYFSAMDELREGDGRGFPESVRRINTASFNGPAWFPIGHHAVFPPEWPRWIINGWCPPGGAVLDPFSGAGTTALVAAVMGRRGIGVELSRDYVRLAQWRAADPRERAKAAGLAPKTAFPSELPGQGTLLDLLSEGNAS